MRRIAFGIRLGAATVLALQSLAAIAADVAQVGSSATVDEADRVPNDGEIIVTAQKRAESLNDVPMSITALSGDQLAAKGITDTSDLAKVVSGFTFNTDPRGAVIYTIRGVGFQESTLAASPTVSVYVDEVPLPYAQIVRRQRLWHRFEVVI